MKEHTRYPWPGPDDKLVVAEMIQNPNSPHWEKCYTLVSRLVYLADIPNDLKDDIVQKTMITIRDALPKFRLQSKLTTWLSKVVNTKVIDALRSKLSRNDRETSLDRLRNPDDNGEPFEIAAPKTTEDECVLREALHEAWHELQKQIESLRSDQDKAVLSMHFLGGYTYQEITRELGINYYRVAYICERTRLYLQNVCQRKSSG